LLAVGLMGEWRLILAVFVFSDGQKISTVQQFISYTTRIQQGIADTLQAWLKITGEVADYRV
jgi:hypothetical protein